MGTTRVVCEHSGCRSRPAVRLATKWGLIDLCDPHGRLYDNFGLVTQGTGGGDPMASAKPKRQPQLPGDDWPEIGSEFGTVTLRPEEDGPVIGAYQGVREVETTDPQGRPRMSTLHAFKLEDGNVVEIWGSYDLDRKLTEELVGQLVRVEYNQTIPISGGAQQLKLYRVRAKG